MLSVASYALYRVVSIIQSWRSAIWRATEINLRFDDHLVAVFKNLAWPIYVPVYLFELIYNFTFYTGVEYDRVVVKKMVEKFGKRKTKEYLRILLNEVPFHVKDLVKEF
jgi:hypothetical protein